jgi:hypothetical protein
MLNDPIVEEIRAFRLALTEPFGADLHAICEDIRQRELESDQQFVTYPPRPPVSIAVRVQPSFGSSDASTTAER